LNSPRKLVGTTSCGRVLDAVAAILEVCFERSYEGEPAMKLESAAKGGTDLLNLEPVFQGETIVTRNMVEKIYDLRAKASVRDLAFSAQQYLATSLAKYAANQAKCLGITCVGFTGGVAYNNQMTSVVERVVVDEGLHFVVPVQVPCGDGGSSFGQACGASLLFSKK